MLHRDVVLAQPVGEEDRPAERLLLVDVGEVLEGDTVGVGVGSGALLVVHQPVLEESGALGCPA